MECANGISWAPRIEPTAVAPPADAEYDERAEKAAEWLKRVGIRGTAFERQLADIDSQLAQDEATQFELGLTALGELLGFEAKRPPTRQAGPDSAWRDREKLWLLFEAKTEEQPQHGISVRVVRQALTHRDWVRNQLGWSEPERSDNVHRLAQTDD